VEASYLSQILYHWYNGMVWTGVRKAIDYEDLWDLNPQDKSRSVVPIFDKYWSRHWKKTISKLVFFYIAFSNIRIPGFYIRINVAFLYRRAFKVEKSSGKLNGAFISVPTSSKDEKEYISILPALIKSFGVTFFFGSFLKLIPDTLAFVSPQILE